MFKISALIWIMLGTVLAGAAVLVVVAVPSLTAEAARFIPIGALAAFIVAMPLSYIVARQITGPRAS